MARQFLTVAEELLEHAECVALHFEARGFTVKVEPTEVGYPYAPTLRCKRAPTTLLVELYGSFPQDRVSAWAGYAKSCTKDTRIALVLPHDAPRSNEDDSVLRDLGVGLYLTDGTRVEEVIAPRDMALNVQLPDLGALPPSVRRALGPAYDQFDHSHWREGFEDACQAVEQESRAYLKKGVETGRLVFVNEKGNTRNLTENQVDGMTLGALAIAFGQVQNQNYQDSVIAKVLKLLNKDRVGVVHFKGKAATEARLRKNVGQHMWRIVAALKALHGAP